MELLKWNDWNFNNSTQKIIKPVNLEIHKIQIDPSTVFLKFLFRPISKLYHYWLKEYFRISIFYLPSLGLICGKMVKILPDILHAKTPFITEKWMLEGKFMTPTYKFLKNFTISWSYIFASFKNFTIKNSRCCNL